MLARQSRSLKGSISANRGLLRLLCCQVADSRMSLCSFFSDQPSAMKRVASQSSSSGMRRRRRLVAEVVGRADEAVAEMVLPDAIDHDAGGQRIGRARDGVGELEPAAAVAEARAILAGQDFEEAARHDLARRLGLAADEDRRVRRLRRVHEDVRAGQRAGLGELEQIALLAQLRS